MAVVAHGGLAKLLEAVAKALEGEVVALVYGNQRHLGEVLALLFTATQPAPPEAALLRGVHGQGGENQLGLDLTSRCFYFKRWISGSEGWKGALFSRRF